MAILEDLQANEVSFVPKGANNKKFIIFKEGDEDLNDIDKQDLSERAENAVRGALRILQAFTREIPSQVFELLNGLIEEEVEDEKQKGVKKTMADKDEMTKEQILELIPESVRKQVEKAWNEDVNLKANVDLPESVRKELDDIRKEKDQLAVALKVEKDQRILKEFQAKATQYSNLNMNNEELGQILKNMSENISKEDYEKIDQVLKAANEGIHQSNLFKEIGSNHATSGSAYQKLESIAKGMIDKGEFKNMPDAINKVLEDHPNLYDDYMNERRN